VPWGKCWIFGGVVPGCVHSTASGGGDVSKMELTSHYLGQAGA
jgi:hypothetical protein